jgi:hypothetical protein
VETPSSTPRPPERRCINQRWCPAGEWRSPALSHNPREKPMLHAEDSKAKTIGIVLPSIVTQGWQSTTEHRFRRISMATRNSSPPPPRRAAPATARIRDQHDNAARAIRFSRTRATYWRIWVVVTEASLSFPGTSLAASTVPST